MAKKRMKIKVKEGALHDQLDLPRDKKIPAAELERLKNSKNPRTRKRVQFALSARRWNRGGKRKKSSGIEESVARAVGATK